MSSAIIRLVCLLVAYTTFYDRASAFSFDVGPIHVDDHGGTKVEDPAETLRKAAEEAARVAQDAANAAAKAAQDAADAAARAAQDVANAQIKAAQDAADAATKAAQDAANIAQRAAEDATNNAIKAAQDTANSSAKAANDAASAAVKAQNDVSVAIEKANKDAARAAVVVLMDARDNAQKALTDATDAAAKVENDITRDALKAAEDAASTTSKAVQDTLNTLNKAGDDIAKNTNKGAQDLIDAAVVVEKFSEKQAKGDLQALDDAGKRIRDGKFVDAVWQAAVAPLKNADINAAEAAQESEILNTVGQVAATAYGGPGGAAAYAAWYTYHQTGNIEMAFRVGLITGATSAAFSAVGELPQNKIAQKAILTGTIGAIAVAAAGGDENAMKEGFLRSGGMVLVQYTYQEVTTHPLDGEQLKASQGDAYCMATLNANCSPPDAAVSENGDVDVRKTDPLRPHVGKWSTADGKPGFVGERSNPMVAVSKVPGMNAMSVFHDQWAVSWDFDHLPLGEAVTVATIPPAVVFTYIGSGSPYYDTLQQAAAKDSKKTAN